MKDPMRLIEADGTEFERLLLQTAAREVPSAEVSARMLAGAASAGAAVALLSSLEYSPTALGSSAVGAGVQTAVVGGAAGSIAPPAAVGLLGSWLVKWGVLGALFSGAVVSGFLIVQGGREHASVRAGAALPSPTATEAAGAGDAPAAPPTSSLREERLEVSAPPAPAARVPAATAAGSTAASGIGAPASSLAPSLLGQELALLDAARRALAAGDAEKALALIASYRKRFPSGALEQEATVLEVDALEAKGRAAQATDLKNQFLAEHPESAHRERVKRSGQNQ